MMTVDTQATTQARSVAQPSSARVPARGSRWFRGSGGHTSHPTVSELVAGPQRDRTPEELGDIAAGFAAHPDLWWHHVGFGGQERVFASLHRDEHLDVWLLCWTPHSDTGWHDHDASAGAVAVAEGEIVEHNLTVGRAGDGAGLDDAGVQTVVAAGRVFCFSAEHIHRVTGNAARSVSVHAYSPPLLRMGQYAVGPDGVLHRVSVSYAEELRPMSPSA